MPFPGEPSWSTSESDLQKCDGINTLDLQNRKCPNLQMCRNLRHLPSDIHSAGENFFGRHYRTIWQFSGSVSWCENVS